MPSTYAEGAEEGYAEIIAMGQPTTEPLTLRLPPSTKPTQWHRSAVTLFAITSTESPALTLMQLQCIQLDSRYPHLKYCE